MRRLRRLFLAGQRAAELFHPCRKAVPVLLAPHDRLAGDPVELNHTAWAGERLMTMPRIIAAAEREQRAFGRGDFENHVVEIVSGAEQPQPATGRFPPGVHVDQDSDDFCL